jgi:hypothetical protein
LWQDFISGEFDVIISDVVMTEISHCFEPKRSFMYAKLAELQYTEVKRSLEAERLADLYFKEGGVPLSSKNDAAHIAIAVVNGCDLIVSWNFKHIVNLRAITSVESVNIKEGYATLRIMSPKMLLKNEE